MWSAQWQVPPSRISHHPSKKNSGTSEKERCQEENLGKDEERGRDRRNREEVEYNNQRKEYERQCEDRLEKELREGKMAADVGGGSATEDSA